MILWWYGYMVMTPLCGAERWCWCKARWGRWRRRGRTGFVQKIIKINGTFLEELVVIVSYYVSSSSERRVPEVAGVEVDHIDHPRSNTEECRQRENWVLRFCIQMILRSDNKRLVARIKWQVQHINIWKIVDHVDHPRSNTEEGSQRENWGWQIFRC